MAWDSGLVGVHRDIAGDPSLSLHVLAGPGTGKTFAMTRRIARLLETGTSPQKILAVTFTRTAARDMHEQLRDLGVAGAERVRVSTLHSFCYGILHQKEVFALTQRKARPVLSYELEQLVNDLAPNFAGKKRVKALLDAFEAGWARLQRDIAGPPTDPVDQEFEAALLDWLRYHRSMLIGELVPLTLTFLRQNPALALLPQFEHVLVDEYQDLNRADQALVVEMARHGAIAVIGDDNQSIYGLLRYANPEGIRTYPQEYPGTTSYVIEECRRCPPNIVAMGNSLISYDQRRMRQIPLAPRGDRAPANVYIVQHDSTDTEVQAVADFIDAYLRDHPDLRPGQVLVLTTRRFIGRNIRIALTLRGRNALTYFFEDPVAQHTAAEGFCLLNLLVVPDDRTALRAWIGLGPSRDGFAAGYRRIQRYAQEHALEPYQVLEQLSRNELRLPSTAGVVVRYQQLRDRLVTLQGLIGLDLVRALWSVDDTESFDLRILAENLSAENPEPDALFAVLLQEITQPELPGSNSDIIRVMSLHKSKELTAALVVIAGCVSGALSPVDRDASLALQDAQQEEQRRLFYVAITRATDTLVMSSAATMLSRDALANGIDIQRQFRNDGNMFAVTAASPFIAELGPAASRPITTAQWRAQAGF